MIWPAIAGAAVSTGLGFGLNKLFGGGGGGSPGGGGGYGAIQFDPYELAGKFRDNFTKDLYLDKDKFDDVARFLIRNVNTNPMFDRNYALSTLSTLRDPSKFSLNKDVRDLMTGTVDRRDAKNLIADQFRLASKGRTASQSFVDDTYESLKRTGQLGSPSSITSGASSQIASLFPGFRSLGERDYELMAQFGPGRLDPESGALLFKTPDIIRASRKQSQAAASKAFG